MHVDRVEAQDTTTDEEEVVREARDRLDECVSAWSTNHDLAEIDIDMRSGKQWDEAVRRQREEDKRPTLTFNRLETFIQQVVGNQRRNRPSIHVAPADLDVEEEIPGAEQKADGSPVTYRKSEVLEGLIRQIEYRSRADAARDTAFDHATGNGFGYYRLVTEYANDRSFDQEIRIKRIRNPFSVYMDPAAETTTFEDATYGFISDWLSEDEFKNLFPDHDPAEDLPRGAGENQAHWWADGKVRIVEYFRKVPKEHTIALVRTMEGTATVNLGDSPEMHRNMIREQGGVILKERKVKEGKVEWRLLNGSNVLEGPIEFPSRYIPIIPVLGREIMDDGEVIYQSLIRHSLDAQKNYNYWRSAMTELVALAPKSPYVGYASAFKGFEDRWETANVKNWAFLPVSDDAKELPQRQRSGDIPAGATQEAQSADYDMKATIGMFEASIGEPSNEKSGRAIIARRQEGETGSYVFMDNLNRAIEHEGRIILDMIPRVYDTDRILRIRQPEGDGDFVRVNVDTPEGRFGDLTSGQWDVAVKAGPSYQTQREEFVESLWDASRANPQLWNVAGDLLIQNMDWPGAQKIADRLRKTIPPQILADEPGEVPPEQPTPEQQADMAKHQATMATAEATTAKAQGDIEREAMKTEQERLQSQQDAYEMQTEIYQMLSRMQEAQQNMAERDIDAEIQNAVSDAITELARQGLLTASQPENRQ